MKDIGASMKPNFRLTREVLMDFTEEKLNVTLSGLTATEAMISITGSHRISSFAHTEASTTAIINWMKINMPPLVQLRIIRD